MEIRFARVKMEVNEDNTGISENCLKHLIGQIIQVEKESPEHYWYGGNKTGGTWNWLDDQLEFFPDGKVIDNASE